MTIETPKFYNHDTWIEYFLEKNKNNLYCNTDCIIYHDLSHFKTQDILLPGKKYKVSFVETRRIENNNNKRILLERNEGLAVGFHGLFLLLFLKKRAEIPFETIVSFNETSFVPEYTEVPYMGPGHKWEMRMGGWSPCSTFGEQNKILVIKSIAG